MVLALSTIAFLEQLLGEEFLKLIACVIFSDVNLLLLMLIQEALDSCPNKVEEC